jgi:4-hydroxy-tetrahydrodipicolinate reductase
MTRIAILGAGGRMGKALVRCSDQFSGIKIAAAIEQPGHPSLGQDAGLAAGAGALGILISDQWQLAAAADVWIDFTFHAAAPGQAARAAELGKAVVVGTTGLTEAEVGEVRASAQRVPIVCSPNMSLGVNLLFALVENAARALGHDYDIEVLEMHHRHKKDAPSGTALALAERAAAGRSLALSAVACHGRSGITGERPPDQIGIHAVRGGDVVGDHTVMFAADGERVELTHRASSRDTFARGALRAAVWVHGRQPGFYSMKHVLGL